LCLHDAQHEEEVKEIFEEMKKNGKCSDGVMVPDENDTWQDWLAKKEKQVARIQVREE